MNKIYLLLLSLFFYNNAIAQSDSEWVIAAYKTGAKYIGEKMAEKDGMVSLRIHTGDTITVNKYMTDVYLASHNALVFSDGKYFETKGRFWSTNFGFDLSERPTIHSDLMYGEQLNSKIGIALGLGSEFNEASVAGFEFDTQFISLFAYGRYSLFHKKTRLFAFGRAGYGFSTDAAESESQRDHKGGLNMKYGFTLQFASRNSSKFQLSIGHYLQKASGRESFLDLIGNELDTEYDIMINRLMFTIGWDF